MPQEVTNPSEFASIIAKPNLTVVDFTATWCGPCRMIAPKFEELSVKYSDCTFIKVDVDAAQEIAGSQGVRAMPTFKFFTNGKELETLQGANPAKLEELIIKHRVTAAPSFGGTGHTIGTSAGSAADAAAARLARFGAGASASSSSSTATPNNATSPPKPPAAAALEDDDEDLAKAIAMSLEQAPAPAPAPAPASASASASAPAPAPTSDSNDNACNDKMDIDGAENKAGDDDKADEGGDPNELVPLPVDAGMLAEVTGMGFSDIRARKGLHFGGNVEGAISWLSEHENDASIDDEFLVRRGDINKKPLSPEEVEAKMKELKELARRRRAEREEQEKKDQIRKEKERRERDQKAQTIQAEREVMQRKREAEKIKKEKADAKAEKARIMAEIARDKEIRAKNKGVLPSVLGVDGYNPSAIKYDDMSGVPEAATAPAPAPAPAPATANVEEVIEKAIANLMRYKTRGDGGNALKLLSLFVKNVAEKPTELKYRSISTESNAYKTKIAPFVGGAALLKAIGFEKREEGKLQLSVDDSDTTSFVPLFTKVFAMLSEAAAQFADG